MGVALRSCVALFASAAVAMAADQSAQQLFDQIRDKVLDNIQRVPRYTCVQNIDRHQYRPQYQKRPARCDALIDARRKLTSPGYLLWRDSLRLDVAVVDGRETFSWAGARQFETTDIGQIASSGSSGSGDFASFLYSVFGMATTRIRLLIEERSPTDLTALFGFDVPLATSHYLYHSSHGKGEERVIGYHGSFLVDAKQAELKRLTVDADHFPADEQMCRVEDSMDYQPVKIGDGDYLLPQTSKMTILFNNGDEAQNETHYSACREYLGESTINFGDEPAGPFSPRFVSASPVKLPPHIHLEIALQKPIDSETASTGDAITGVVVHEVRNFAHANDIVEGRILRLEQDLWPNPRWIVALRFNRIEHNGVEQPVELAPTDDGNRPMRGITLFRQTRPPGAGVFIFQGTGKLVLDRTFHSAWVTR